jgi:hypothetical protein
MFDDYDNLEEYEMVSEFDQEAEECDYDQDD